MNRGERGEARGALRFAVLEIGGDEVGIAALDEERCLHALAQEVLARPIGVPAEEGEVVPRLAMALAQAIPVDQLAADGIAHAGFELGRLGNFVGGERFDRAADFRRVVGRQVVLAQRRDDLIEAGVVGGLACLR